MNDAGPPDPVGAEIARLPPLRTLIAEHALGARKALGQHFLLDLNLTARIARAAGALGGATVIEIGPGPGGLTRAILSAGAAHVVAVEKDARCRAALAPLITAAAGRLHLVDADALAVDERALLEAQDLEARGVHIIANLPYNVGTVLILKWLRQIARDCRFYSGLVLTLQKEVADRLVAPRRTKAYGRLSVMCQWLTDAAACFDIGARAFTPPPKVDSTVLRLVPRGKPLAPAGFAPMETVVGAAFGQRRKMLRASLRGIAPDGRVDALLNAAGVVPTARAEELSVAEFCAIARSFDDMVSARRAAP